MGYSQEDLEVLFRAFDRLLHNCVKNMLDARGIGEASHPQILFTLRFNMDGMKATQKEIGDAIGISPATVATSVKRMEKAGLLNKVSDKKDLRCNIITLTKKGVTMADECSAAFEEFDNQIFKDFTNDEREQLKTYYLRMLNNIESIGKKLKKNDGKEEETNE